jgi:hypothetical protein
MREVRTLVHSLKLSSFREGFVTLCRDSLLRNFSLFGKVANYNVLNTEQVSSAVRLFTSNELLAPREGSPGEGFQGSRRAGCSRGDVTKPDVEVIPEVLKKGRA